MKLSIRPSFKVRPIFGFHGLGIGNPRGARGALVRSSLSFLAFAGLSWTAWSCEFQGREFDSIVLPTECEGLVDLDGKPAHLGPLGGGLGVVFVFVRIDCPISNRYAPEIQKMAEDYSPSGIHFRLVYPDPEESAPQIAEHRREFGYEIPALRDLSHRLVEACGVNVTPEIAVFQTRGELVYRGRIDNRYVDFGKARPEATKRDLDEVLHGLLAKENLAFRSTTSVGCPIPELR